MLSSGEGSRHFTQTANPEKSDEIEEDIDGNNNEHQVERSITPITDRREHLMDGLDAGVQCNNQEMDKTLDQYIEDLREANKQADIRTMQMQTIDLFPSDQKVEGQVDCAEVNAPICESHAGDSNLLSTAKEENDMVFYQNDFLE